MVLLWIPDYKVLLLYKNKYGIEELICLSTDVCKYYSRHFIYDTKCYFSCGGIKSILSLRVHQNPES